MTRSQRAAIQEEESFNEEELGEEKVTKINHYDSSYFSQKMQKVDLKGKPRIIDTVSSPSLVITSFDRNKLEKFDK